MSLRRTIVEVSVEGLNVTEFCRQHGISTWLFYELRRRYAAGGEAALSPRSRAPKRVANRTGAETEDRIVALRKELEAEGLDAGAATIAYHLRQARGRAPWPAPSEATIWRVLVRRGFIVAQPHKAPKHAHRRFQAERANECWQVDDTEWVLADGTVVKIIDILDDCSRMVVASHASRSCTAASALEAFTGAAKQWGWPERFLSDNGRTYRYALAEAVGALGVAAGHARPYHPQTCGKVERFHQTLKRFLAAHPAAATLAELQAQLDRFLVIYNYQRPHRGIERRIPAEVWASTPKSGPATLALSTPTAVYRGTVEASGRLTLSNKYVVGLGIAHARQAAITVITGAACHVFTEGHLTRAFTLDPSRRTQPRKRRPDRATSAGPPARLTPTKGRSVTARAGQGPAKPVPKGRRRRP
jgi:transposase InsO family protein